MGQYEPRDVFPFERGIILEERVRRHGEDLTAMRELINTMRLEYRDESRETRATLGTKVDKVVEEQQATKYEVANLRGDVLASKRFLVGMGVVVGFAAPLIVSLVVKFA